METFNSLFMVSPLLSRILFLVAMLAGSIDSIAGGGRLFTIPALMAAGMSLVNVLATNKLQACGDSISVTTYFVRRKVVSLSDQKLDITMTFAGSMGDTLPVQYVQTDVLRQILPTLVVCISLHLLLIPKLEEEDHQRRTYGLPFALVTRGCIGLYDGFFDPVAGSLHVLAFVTPCGFNLTKAIAYTKLPSATSNIGGLLLLILSSEVVWTTGFVMLVGQFLGARMGSGLVLSRRQKLTRPVIVIVSAVMNAKLLYGSHEQEIFYWLGMN